MTQYQTEQENFWAGEFGEDYIGRNLGSKTLAANLALFSRIIPLTSGVDSLLEFGANIGKNLRALRLLLPEIKLSAVEINPKAAAELEKIGSIDVHNCSILEFTPDTKKDMVLIKGVLIHMNPDVLQSVYQKLYEASAKYICIAEYYNPVPVELDYRGHTGKLFKRDFAGEIMEKYPDLELIDYGFAYRNDPNFEFGDVTWFLLRK